MASTGASCRDLSKAGSHWTMPAGLCPELRGKLQQTAAAAGRHSTAGGRHVRLHLLSWTPCQHSAGSAATVLKFNSIINAVLV